MYGSTPPPGGGKSYKNRFFGLRKGPLMPLFSQPENGTDTFDVAMLCAVQNKGITLKV